MPGVPSEMFAMFETQVKPRLLALGLGGGVLVQRKINCLRRRRVGRRGEAARPDPPRPRPRGRHHRQRRHHLAAHPRPGRRRRDEAQAQIAPVEQTIRERLGDLVFGVEDEELQDAVVRLLAEKRQTLATAESVTAGLVAQRLGRVPGASDWFRGGIVAYDNRAQGRAARRAADADRRARRGQRRRWPRRWRSAAGTRLRTDLAVSTVGIAGPGGGTPGQAGRPGLRRPGLGRRRRVAELQLGLAPPAAEIQSRTAKLALNRVRAAVVEKSIFLTPPVWPVD